MNTIHVLVHKASSYTGEWSMLRAFADEKDATDLCDLIGKFVVGELKVVALELEPSKRPPVAMRWGDVTTAPLREAGPLLVRGAELEP